MGKKSGPPAPDYTAAAEKTATSNNAQLLQQTYANRPTQTDPWGSVSWESTQAKGPDGKPLVDQMGQPVMAWTQNTKLDPRLQNALNSQIATQQGRSDLANQLMPRVNEEFLHQIDFGQFTPLSQGANATTTRATTNPFGMGPQMQNFNTGLAAVPKLQNDINYGNLQDVGNADATRQAAYDSIYNQATSRLDPQWQQQQAQLDAKLANQGITQGSDAYNKAMDQFARQRTDAYNQAMMSATQGAGQQAQIDYGINMGLRQQQATEAQNAAQFRNAALGSAFGYGQQALGTQQAAQQAAWQQALGGAQFGSQQQNQAFNQNLAANQQNFNQQQAVASYQNTLRQQQIAEAQQQQNWSLNALNALLSGQQVQNPSFANFSQAGMGAGVDYSGAADAQFQAGMAKQSMQNAATGQLVQGGMSAAMMFSDARVKTGVRTIGRDPRGWRLVSFRYIGERGRRLGVLAHEVQRFRPDAVAANEGVLMVDYALLYGA